MTQRIFEPEAFGAIGDGDVDDTKAIQKAIDGASDGGGIVLLTKQYHVTLQGRHTSVIGSTVDYMLWVNADNVHLVGPGQLLVKEKPSTGYPVAILFGNGGSTSGRPGSTGTWIERVGMSGITIDASALSDADRWEMVGGDVGSLCFVQTVVFSYCRDWHIRGCAFNECWGGNSIFGSYASSRDGVIADNVSYRGIGRQATVWCDGAQGVRIVNNEIKDAFGYGIVVQSNLDNCDINDENDGDAGKCFDNIVSGNRIEFGRNSVQHRGVAFVGCSDSEISNNLIVGVRPGYAIELRAYAHHNDKTTSSRNSVSGNYCRSDVSVLLEGFRLWGYDENPLDGEPLTVEENVFTGNYVQADLLGNLGEQVKNNQIVYNVADADTMFTSNDTATDNTTEPNVQV